MPDYFPIPGKDAAVQVFGTWYNFKTWKWNLKADVLMLEGFEDNGWQFPVDGILGGQIQLGGMYDATLMPDGLFWPGTFGQVVLYISYSMGLYVYGDAMVAECPLGSDVRQAGTFDLTMEPKGPHWTLSDGTQLGLEETGL